MEMVGAKHVEAFGDSELVVQQVAGAYCLDGSLNSYLDQCLDIIASFDNFAIRHIGRHDNPRANDLAQQASGYNVKRGVFLILEELETEEDWSIPLVRYLKDPTLKVDRKIRRQAFKYTLLDGDLYRRNIDGVLLKCLDDDQSKVAMGEVHEGICETYQSAHKMNWLLRRAGFYWLRMIEDCFKYYRGCEACQWFGNVQLAPSAMLNPIIKPWPFRGWALDFIGQIYPSSSKGHRFVLVSTDYFTKWAEAMPLKNMTHTEANGQAESSNKTLLKLVKKKIKEYPKKWHKVLSEALWAHRISKHGATKVTPFELVYGQEVGLPVEVNLGSLRYIKQDDLSSEDYKTLMGHNLDEVIDKRLKVLEEIEKEKKRVAKAYNKRVRAKLFQVGDLVWKTILPLGTRSREFGERFQQAINGKYLKKYFPSVWPDA
uniref:Polyprotein n=2 Tax=Oryza sativa subsp. japonica TaxID=39947 RepID=A0A5S6R9U0_ORYSJ|nr:Putative polyprotein [Oryza sativa Japonica Group]AAP51754.1 retrotransposon protein, putative, unclassified [Oryza sativa Japonica Group]